MRYFWELEDMLKKKLSYCTWSKPAFAMGRWSTQLLYEWQQLSECHLSSRALYSPLSLNWQRQPWESSFCTSCVYGKQFWKQARDLKQKESFLLATYHKRFRLSKHWDFLVVMQTQYVCTHFPPGRATQPLWDLGCWVWTGVNINLMQDAMPYIKAFCHWAKSLMYSASIYNL